MSGLAIGVYVHAEPDRLRDTLASLAAHTASGYELLLLADGPDAATRAALGQMPGIAQSATEAPKGAAACFNRFCGWTGAETLVLLESGVIVGPGWADGLAAALGADATHGLACPSTNLAWNQLAVFPDARSAPADIAATADEAARRFGRGWRSLAPLWDVGDFCLAVRRAVVDAIGPADETYGLGGCWEMDYAARAARAGYRSVWAQGAYVFRSPITERRREDEARLFEASRRRYQDQLCGLRRSGARTSYAQHCHGEDCPHFAPSEASVPASRNAAACERSPPPLVSCIMPTRGRGDWVPQAIRYFQNQNYPALELIVIDGDPEDRADAFGGDPRIRRERVPAHWTIGAMRNRACELARGEVVIFWDDDDWYADNRVSTQVQPILEGVADITALSDMRFFDLDAWSFWRCSGELHRRLFRFDVAGGTTAFRRSIFQRDCRFPHTSLAEDADFIERAVTRGARLQALPATGLYIYLRHGANTWRFPCGQYLDPSGWRREVEPAELAAERPFYVARSVAAGGRPLQAPTARSAPAVRAAPLASCIMPTANRRAFVPSAIAQFLAQDYPMKELVILDDGDDPVADLIPDHPLVRYMRAPRHRNLGAKRNAACEAARGEIILHWDDDDWYAPRRIRAQVEALAASGGDACGIDRALFVDPGSRRAWEYVYPAGGPPWVCGATLCYPRAYWRDNQFAELNIGEDTRFAATLRPDRLHRMADNRCFVALVHPANPSPKQVEDRRWRPHAYEDVVELTGGAWPALAAEAVGV